MMLEKEFADSLMALEVGWLLCHLRCWLPPTPRAVYCGGNTITIFGSLHLRLEKEALVKNLPTYECSEKIYLLNNCYLSLFSPKSRAQDKNLGRGSLLGK